MKKYFYLLAAFVLFCGCSSNDTLFKEALNKDREGKTEQALQIYSKILKNEPEHFSALANRAVLYEKLGDLKRAEADYKKAYKLYPRSMELLNNMGSFYLKQDKNGLAIYYLTKALELKDDYFSALVNRAAAYQKIASFDAAYKDLKKAQDLQPENQIVLLNHAIFQYDTGNYLAAAQEFTDLILRNPKNPKNYYRRAMAERKLRQYANALEDCSAALTLQKDYIVAIFCRAEMLYAKGDYEAALADLNDLKSINNKYIPAYDFAGDILSLDDPQNAALNYQVAAQLDPKNTKRYQSKIKALKTNNGRKYITKRRFEMIDKGDAL